MRTMTMGLDGIRMLALVLALLACGASSLTSQEGASLNEVESLAGQGRIMEAREALEGWWTTRFSTASRAERQRGIWLRAKLTVDPSMAEMDFRRLALEFPGGAYSDDALYRLGLSADLRGALLEAQRSFESLLRGYPSSPRVPEAQRWIETHAGEVALAEEVPDPTPPVPVESVTGAEEVTSGESDGVIAVQLGAFRSLERARALADDLREQGFDPRLVRTSGNELARVRIGRFQSRLRAEALARDLTGRGFEVTLAMDAGSEERIGRPSTPGG